MKPLRVLIGCEESQEVCKAFRALGHEAYSCDLIPCSGGHPEWHLQMDVFEAIAMGGWDLGIFHPPCTYMSRAGARWMYLTAGTVNHSRLQKAMEAKAFFMKLCAAPIDRIAIENPLPLRIVGLPNPSQIIQPYEFGDPFSKKTLLWLKNLSPLMPTEILANHKPYLPSNTGGGKRGTKATFKNISQRDSSKTFPGIARAMALQWSNLDK